MRHLFFLLVLFTYSAHAQDISPKDPWGDLEQVEIKEQTTLTKVLLWLPNRVADLTDIFKFDVGVGTSYGAVLRISKEGQLGFRRVPESSVRLGHFGRESPYILRVEKSNEVGVGPYFTQSKQRQVCKGELGIGVDLFAGIYGGVCFDEIIDFVSGLGGGDFKGDDF